MKLILSAICTIIYITAFTQPAPGIQWQRSLGGSADDGSHSIEQTKDSGYIIAGSSQSNNGDVIVNHGWDDYWIVKLNKKNKIQWQKSFGGSNSEVANSIKQTIDGGYIIAGYTGSSDGDITGNHGGDDYWIVKLNKSGSIQWQKCLGGSDDDQASDIQQTKDSGYIVVGYSYSLDGDVNDHHAFTGGGDCWIVKLDKSGNIQWQKIYGGRSSDGANSVQQTKDGGYIVAGYASSVDGDVVGNHGKGDYWIFKLDKKGKMTWQKCYGGKDIDWANSIQQTIDGGYIVAGGAMSTDGDVTGNHIGFDFWIIKLTAIGNLQWQKSYGGTGDDMAQSIRQTIDGGYIVAGVCTTNSGDVKGNHGGKDYWIIKLKKNGNVKWKECLGGSFDEGASAVLETADSGYIITGSTRSSDGDVSSKHGASDINSDFWIVKLNKDSVTKFAAEKENAPVIAQNKNSVQTNNKDFIIYPNPVKDILHIQAYSGGVFSLINSSGKTVLTKVVDGSVNIDVSSLPSGIYYVKNDATGVAKEVIIKK